MDAIVEFKDVSLTLDKKEVLSSINLSVGENEITGIIGPSGAGKTVLLKTIIGFYTPCKGQVLYKGAEIKGSKEIMKLSGFASQGNSIYPDLTVKENLYYFGRMYGLKKKEIEINGEEVLALVELAEEKKKLASHLSGGMRKRLDLACALIHKPKLLILDEPISGLDPVLRGQMLELIQKIKNSGTSIVISSHFMREIEPICDRIVIVSKGKIMVQGRTNDIINAYPRIFEVKLRSYPGDYSKLYRLIGSRMKLMQSYIKKNHLCLKVAKEAKISDYLVRITQSLKEANEELLDIEVNKLSLDDIFRKVAFRK